MEESNRESRCFAWAMRSAAALASIFRAPMSSRLKAKAFFGLFSRSRSSRNESTSAGPRASPGQQKGDSTSLQLGCSARARSRSNVHASRPFREMIARRKISQNEWKTTERGAFEVGQ